MDFSETIEVKVEDKDNSLPVDTYFFAYFHNLTGALDQIRDAVRNSRSQSFFSTQSPAPLLDTTAPRSPMSPSTSAASDSNHYKGTSFRFSSLFRPFLDTSVHGRGSESATVDSNTDDYTHVQRKDNSSFIPISSSPKASTSVSSFRQGTDSSASSRQTSHSLPIPHHTYPPSTSNPTIYPNTTLNRESTSHWGIGVPAWIKSRRALGSALDSQVTPIDSHIKEIYSSAASSPGPMPTSRSLPADLAFSVLETPELSPDHETTEKFRSAFAYDEKETLLGCKLFGDLTEGC